MATNKRADLSIPTFAGDLFTWSRGVTGNSIGVADRSDLPRSPVSSRVWRDACDVGFYVHSGRTGRDKLFTFSQELKDNDGDVIAWVFESADDDGVDIHILND